MPGLDPYSSLGLGYAEARREDRRIAAQIHESFPAGASVINVGAGAGSYEPDDCLVTAVEPSEVMRRQRPPGRAAARDVSAESLPFGDDEFDVALAIFTVHHWNDPQAGLAEMRRVSRRQIIVTWDAPTFADFWLVAEYLPEIADHERGLITARGILDLLLDEADVRPLWVPSDCTDGFLAAYWRRPEMYLSAERRAAASGLAKLPSAVLDRGLGALRRDLEDGTWRTRHAELLDLDEFDPGYRVIVVDKERLL